MKLITFTSDFGKQSQGIAAMKGLVLKLCPAARFIDIMHGIEDFDIKAGARALETTAYLPVGCHVCVVDPGVGTARKGIAILTKRGDYLIGPDNGVLIPAAKRLGGIIKAVALENPKYQAEEVSPIFHGRDVFSAAASHLANGVNVEEFGRELREESLAEAAYEDALIEDGTIKAEVIHINKFGSVHLNILHETWDKLGVKPGSKIVVEFNNQKVILPFNRTFGDVEKGRALIMKDDFGRIELARNLASFVKEYKVEAGEKVRIRKYP